MSSNNTLRKVLHSAYTFVRGVEVNKAIASLTLDHLIQEQIDSYKQSSERTIIDARGENVGSRISKLDSLDELEQELDSVVKSIQKAGTDAEKLREIGIFEADSEDSQS